MRNSILIKGKRCANIWHTKFHGNFAEVIEMSCSGPFLGSDKWTPAPSERCDFLYICVHYLLTAQSPVGILSEGACMMLTSVGIRRICMGPWQPSICASSLKMSWARDATTGSEEERGDRAWEKIRDKWNLYVSSHAQVFSGKRFVIVACYTLPRETCFFLH